LAYRRPDEADVAPLFEICRAKWRLGMYAVLATLDICVIALVHWLFQPHTGYRYLALQLVLYALLAAKLQGWGLTALRHPREGALRAAIAAATAPLILIALVFVFDRRELLTAGFALETFATVSSLFFARRIFAEGCRLLLDRRLTNEVVIVDGEPSLSSSQRGMVTAEALGIAPVASDPAMLNRIGQLLKNCDRVIIDTAADRRAAWLETLRGIDVDVEFTAAELDNSRPFELRTINGQFTLLVRRGALRPALRVQKRLFDVVFASAALLMLAPLMLVLAAAICIDTPGPILFRQRRVGRGNRHFTIFKFRTMHHGRVDVLGTRSTARDDDRVTRMGAFMRRTSLDELPQLLNVFAGDMSIVGPRPHALGSRAGDQLFWDVDALYWERHAIKPGMTGLAQIRGFRGATNETSDITQRLRSDIEYIANWSLMSDITIVLRTVGVVIHDKAY
jgi:exopolysaccharide biosynthesis polyprenyl glycosylphosphotransferase